jgi:cysteinyl-tRNA synthetase
VGRAALEAIDATYRATAGEVLGILPQDGGDKGSAQREAALIELIVQMRMQARKSKNWAESDRLRDELAKIGVILEDRPDGTVWKVN